MVNHPTQSLVFISYSSKDGSKAEEVHSELKKTVNVWRDTTRLKGGQLWPLELGKAIRKSRAVVLLWSVNAFSSYFVRDEWCIAYALKKPIIPLLLDDTELPASLLARQSIQMEDGWEERLRCGINESASQIIGEAHPAILENLASIGKFSKENLLNSFVQTVRCLGYDTPEDLRYRAFMDWMAEIHQKLPVKGLAWNRIVDVKIEQVYVRMRGWFNRSLRDPTKEEEESSRERWVDRGLSAVDIRTALDYARKSETRTLVITGKAGSGKTILQKYLFICMARGKGPLELGLPEGMVPFYIAVKELSKKANVEFLEKQSVESFFDFALNSCRLQDFGVNRERLMGLFQKGRGIFLLDGLDELADDSQRKRVYDWIDEVRRSPFLPRFIITSRPYVYYGEKTLDQDLPVLRLSIEDFSDGDIRRFCGNWFALMESEDCEAGKREHLFERGRKKGEAFAKKVIDSNVRELAANPLMLQIMSLLCANPDEKETMDVTQVTNKAGFMKRCADVLLEKWNTARGFNCPLPADKQRELLEPLGLWLHKDGRDSAPEEEVIEEIEAPLSRMTGGRLAPKALLKEWRDRSGIFVGHTTVDYGFSLHQWQEYMAAECLGKLGAQASLLADKWENPEWREVILMSLHLGGAVFAADVVAKVIRKPFFKHNTTLLARALDSLPEKPVSILAEGLKDLQISGGARENLVRLLGGIGDESVIEALNSAVESQDSAIDTAAYEELARLDKLEGVTRPSLNVSRELVRFLKESEFFEPIDGSFERIRSTKDGMEMVLVPQGSFLYGSTEDDSEADDDEKPQQTIHVPEFYMDKDPVTNAQYKKFVDETGHHPPDKADYTWGGGPIWKGIHFPEEYSNHPVICVSWKDAVTYATWAGKRLPSEIEWEKAARGTDGRKYPWGDEWNNKNCNNGESGPKQTTEVGKFGKKGESPYGCQDMAGNVWEWCREWFSDSNKKGELEDKFRGPAKGSERVIRGGGCYSDSGRCRAAFRDGFVPGSRDDFLGFRCASPRGHQEQAQSRAEKQSGAGSEPRTR